MMHGITPLRSPFYLLILLLLLNTLTVTAKVPTPCHLIALLNMLVLMLYHFEDTSSF